MSLICGALKWLKDSDERDRKEVNNILTGEQRYICNCIKPSVAVNGLYSCWASCEPGKSCNSKGKLDPRGLILKSVFESIKKYGKS